MTEQDIYVEAMNREDASERGRFLDEACGQNRDLRARLEKLIQHSGRVGDFLEQPPAPLARSAEAAVDCVDIGTQIGPYRICDPIGEGGFGVVFLAEQERPVRRKVALKIIKPGMDTRQVIARFEAERQALAMMDHPNIAKVLDAGATKNGRPYFVMELVQGVPITEYCDRTGLTTRERLELFITVCQAVQHAHQKGVIHRDIKPTNVLVAMQDGKPAPKIIDFGVAKALNQRLTEHTLATGYAQIIGTPLYMSPEQAELSPLGADTRSDIYSLGVLLYELLTGTTPFDKERLHSVGYDEMRRIIREEEPPRPSARLISLPLGGRVGEGVKETAALATTIAEHRRTDPRRLAQTVRGELDWVVMKCLEKDRNRRYETASTLAADIELYLNDEPVCACPPSAAYRFRKFARRNKRAITASVVMSMLILISAVNIASTARDRRAQQLALQQNVSRLLEESGQKQQQSKWLEAIAAVNRAEALVLSSSGAIQARRTVQERLADLKLVAELERVRERWQTEGELGLSTNNDTDLAYGHAFREFGIDLDTLDPSEAGKRILSHSVVVEIGAALDHWALVRQLQKDTSGARRLLAIARAADDDLWRNQLRELLEAEKLDMGKLVELSSSAPIDTLPPSTLVRLSEVLDAAGMIDKAGEILRQAQRKHPTDFWINLRLGDYYRRIKPAQMDLRLRFIAVAAALRPESPVAQSRLGMALLITGHQDEALIACRESVRLNPNAGYAYAYLGYVLAAKENQERLDEANSAYRRAIRLGLDRRTDAWARGTLVNSLILAGQLDEASTELKEYLRLYPDEPRPHKLRGQILAQQNRLDDAIIVLRNTVRRWPEDGSSHFTLGNALIQKGLLVEAIYHSPEEMLPLLRHRTIDEGLLDDAIHHYREAVRFAPNDGVHQFALAHALYRKGNLDEAIYYWREAVQKWPWRVDFHETLASSLRSKGHVNEAIETFQTAIQRRPVFARLHKGLADTFAATGRVEDAIAAYRDVIRLAPDDHWNWYRSAALLLYADDLEAHQNACQEMLHRFGRSELPEIAARVAKTCLLTPVGIFERQPALQLAEQAVTGTEQSPSFREFALTKALAELRAGQCESAVKWLDRFPANPDGDSRDASAFAVLALARNRLGQTSDAHTALMSAQAIIIHKMPVPEKGQLLGGAWHNWLHSQVLIREAERSLNTLSSGQSTDN